MIFQLTKTKQYRLFSIFDLGFNNLKFTLEND